MGKETKNLVLEVSSGIVIFTVAAVGFCLAPAGDGPGSCHVFFHGGGAGPLHEDGRFEDCPEKDGDQFGHPLCRAFCCSGYRRGLVSGSGQCGCPSNRSPRTQGWCISAAGYTQDRVTWEKRGVIFVYRSRCDQVRKEA